MLSSGCLNAVVKKMPDRLLRRRCIVEAVPFGRLLAFDVKIDCLKSPCHR
jgi:hypothetical protein